MTTRLYIARHGQSEWNLHNKMQGVQDIDLTPTGLKQAELLASRLKNEKIDCIYSSDLKRAYVTAQIIAKELGLEVQKIPEFREMSFGIWEGLTSEEINELYKEIYTLWKTNPVKANIEKGETLEEVQKRMVKNTLKIVEENKGKNILIVSHGTSIKALILGLLGIDLSFYPRFRLDNTSLNIIDVKEDGKTVLVLFNDTCHLRRDEKII
ncbi:MULTISPECIES: histidine phosphatase family protein [Thermoanaerobacter]|uniref:Fructose-2,6-bisphosphatase n=2 Tax=Thermoanaerobacter TaxID=1754 RepID=I9KVY3_9THEO|nr:MULTISPECIES: histidine phosphatase family protein [Thermoanaerobacter]AEM78724.1 Phosphoglycerate mutase [Thermoanaerobacter wiegelii Rt8.B1]EIW01194.1 fructose-2,6-bisphosphatase [Thermoanaerobacter siderophilus SR4]UZQ84159.1 histidine phosphatase family protein [Thermoanaerobacter sp. RKWS2]